MAPSNTDRHTLKSHFLDQFAYDLWANDRIISAIEELSEGETRRECLRLTSHLLRATTRWLERIIGEGSTTIDKVDDILSLRERANANARAWQALFEERTAADFPKDVEYRNMAGETFYTELRVIVAHVLNHATHHRAQVVRHIRLADIQPPETGLIVFDRERAEEEDEADDLG
jgi:uncharacterized damage-inducible protein DinB